ncbi:MAG: hypothetical protein JWO38_1757 [Gemmataceae bacterium]|nr:hypothetical protein [Gemmataceae bacterium]
MKKWALLFSLAVAGLAAVPDTGEACGRRRGRPVSCPPAPCPPAPCPLVVFPAYQPPPIPPAIQTVTIKGRTYQLLDAADQGEFEEQARPATVTGAGIAGDDTFTGTDRMLPKTTILAVEVEEFATVAEIVDQLLTKSPDAMMEGMVTKTSDTRAAAETRNVRVTGFIHAFKKEGDNDYHVILGDGAGAEPAVFLNVEVSGIPVGGTAANRKRLVAVRDQFKQAFNLGATGPAGYKRPDEPVPVRITGSLFWDVDHKPGAVGPSDLKPKTAWEIHPVSEIEFLGN